MFQFRAGRSWSRLALFFLVPAPGNELPNVFFGESVHACDHVANKLAPVGEVSDRLLTDAKPRSDILHRQVGPGWVVGVLFWTACHRSGSEGFKTELPLQSERLSERSLGAFLEFGNVWQQSFF